MMLAKNGTFYTKNVIEDQRNVQKSDFLKICRPKNGNSHDFLNFWYCVTRPPEVSIYPCPFLHWLASFCSYFLQSFVGLLKNCYLFFYSKTLVLKILFNLEKIVSKLKFKSKLAKNNCNIALKFTNNCQYCHSGKNCFNTFGISI